MQPIVLASTSTYRKAILDKLKIPFEIDSPNIDEQQQPNETAESLVERLALEKAQAVALRHPNALIIGSDQVAVLGDQILGKPIIHQRAVEQLQACRGQRITFLTALCLLNSGTNHPQQVVEPFHVQFKDLNDQQIENYLIKEQPYNCAGSFKSEGLGISLFSKLEGDDPNSLIGLPLIRLVAMLEKEGVEVI
ncbi:MAG: Maf family nucleotide pyrophosphatase [Motiliproteus sp.]|nr:Maf family nucleotide pyrophosphatase [Motiliproteus sp.]MCW9052963.1 Maf family nucleotide pyrophosphatase [Motiliproteus sp.]